MKTVFRTNEIAHVWMHKSAPYGRCPGNASFDGDAFRSYSTVIARHCEHKGKPYIIHDATTFSSSTGKTQSHLRRAFDPSVPVFYYNQGHRGQDLRVTPAQLFDHAVRQSADCETKAARARAHKGDWQANAAVWLERAARINTFFGLRRKVDDKVVERLKAAALREEKKNAKRRAEEEKRLAVINAERDASRRQLYERWKNGEGDVDTHNFYNLPVAFRVEENELVSTMGARIPLDAARVALRFIMRKRGQDWRENGETCPIGHYRLNAINPQGIVAGCHRVTWEEVERVAGLLAEPVADPVPA